MTDQKVNAVHKPITEDDTGDPVYKQAFLIRFVDGAILCDKYQLVEGELPQRIVLGFPRNEKIPQYECQGIHMAVIGQVFMKNDGYTKDSHCTVDASLVTGVEDVNTSPLYTQQVRECLNYNRKKRMTDG